MVRVDNSYRETSILLDTGYSGKCDFGFGKRCADGSCNDSASDYSFF